jgi:hypothetical protein
MFKNIIFLAILLMITSCSGMYQKNQGLFRQKNAMQPRGYYIADEQYLEDDYDDDYQEEVIREERYPVYRESYPVREEIYEYEDDRYHHYRKPHAHHRSHCTHGSVPRRHQHEDCPKKSYHVHGFYRR